MHMLVCVCVCVCVFMSLDVGSVVLDHRMILLCRTTGTIKRLCV